MCTHVWSELWWSGSAAKPLQLREESEKTRPPFTGALTLTHHHRDRRGLKAKVRVSRLGLCSETERQHIALPVDCLYEVQVRPLTAI